MGPIAAEAGGIEVDVTDGGAFEGIDQAMHSTGCARLADVERYGRYGRCCSPTATDRPQPGSRQKCHRSPAAPPARIARAFLGRTPGPMHRPSGRRAEEADRPGAR